MSHFCCQNDQFYSTVEQAAYKHPRSVYSLLGKEKTSKDSAFEVNSAKLEAMVI